MVCAAYKSRSLKCLLTEAVKRLLYTIHVYVCLHLNEICHKGVVERVLVEGWRKEGGGGTMSIIKIQLPNLIENHCEVYLEIFRWQQGIIRYKEEHVWDFIPAALAKCCWVFRLTWWCNLKIRSSPQNVSLDLQTLAKWRWPGQSQDKDTKVWKWFCVRKKKEKSHPHFFCASWFGSLKTALNWKQSLAQNRTRSMWCIQIHAHIVQLGSSFPLLAIGVCKDKKNLLWPKNSNRSSEKKTVKDI